ncbi:MAG: DUF4158 domain-containing protein [Actinomycetota bacterium]
MPVTWESAARPEGTAKAARPATRPGKGTGRSPEGATSPQISYDEDELRSFFTLTAEDLELVRATRSARNRLGLALLLAWMRAERRAVSDPATLPGEVIAFVARQLEVEPEVLEGYGTRRATRTAHVAAVCGHLGLRTLTPADEQRLDALLHAKAGQTGRASALAEAADDWLFSEGLLRPAQDRVDRLVRHARAEAEEELFAQVCRQLTQGQGTRLDALCEPAGQGESPLALLRSPPRAPSAAAIRLECRRLVSIRSLLPEDLDWGAITTNRRRQWAAVVRRLYARDLSRYPPPKGRTLMLAFLTVRAEEVTDAIVEMFDVLVGRVFTRAGDALTEVKARQNEAHVENAPAVPGGGRDPAGRVHPAERRARGGLPPRPTRTAGEAGRGESSARPWGGARPVRPAEGPLPLPPVIRAGGPRHPAVRGRPRRPRPGPRHRDAKVHGRRPSP